MNECLSRIEKSHNIVFSKIGTRQGFRDHHHPKPLARTRKITSAKRTQMARGPSATASISHGIRKDSRFGFTRPAWGTAANLSFGWQELTHCWTGHINAPSAGSNSPKESAAGAERVWPPAWSFDDYSNWINARVYNSSRPDLSPYDGNIDMVPLSHLYEIDCIQGDAHIRCYTTRIDRCGSSSKDVRPMLFE